MNSSLHLKEIAPCEKELQVEVPAAEVQSEFESVYQDLRRVAQVPGFRKGSAPRDLIEQYHGTRAREEVLRRLIDKSLGEALGAQKSLDVVGRPEITKIDFDAKKPLVYSARVEVAPEVPLKKYKGVSLTRQKVHVTEEAMTQVIDHLKEQHAQLKTDDLQRAAAAGDFLLVDLTERRKGHSPVKRPDVVIHLDLEKDVDGTLKKLVGLNPGESTELILPNGTEITVRFKELKVKEVPAVDDAFAKVVGPYENLEALTKSIREGLEKQGQEAQRRSLENQATRYIQEEWVFDVPPSLVASHARRILKEHAVDLMSQGIAADQVQNQAHALADQTKLDALRAVKLFFALRRIAREEKMTATQEEMEARLQAISQRLQVPVEKVRDDLKAKDLLEEVAWGIIRGKVVDLIIQEATIQEVDSGEKS